MSNELNNLRDTIDKFEDLYDVLSCYTGSKDTHCIIEDLKFNDTLWAMSEQSDVTESDLAEWINEHWESSVSCEVFKECGPRACWPVVSVKCMDKTFYFDWVTE